MKRHTTGSRSDGGFTLIEIMVVALIIGIMAALIVPNISGPNPRRDLAHEAERIEAVLHSALQDAVLRAEVLAVAFDEDYYRVYALERDALTFVPAVSLPSRYALPKAVRVNVLDTADMTTLHELITRVQDKKAEERAAAGLAAENAGSNSERNTGEDASAESPTVPPQVWLFPNGEMTPVEIELFSEVDTSLAVRLRFSPLGHVEEAWSDASR